MAPEALALSLEAIAMRSNLSLRSRIAALAVLACALTASGATAASKKTAGKAVDKRPIVAVLYFDYTGKDAEMAVLRKGLAQMLISDLSAIEAVRMVERDRLQEILSELKLQQSKRFDPKTAGKIGKLLGARFMVLGGYFAMMGTLRVDARVVEVETGRVIKSVGANGKLDTFIDIEQKVSGGIATILRGALPPRVASKKKRRKSRPKASRRRVPPPKRLRTRTALRYAKALDARDRGDVKRARVELEKVVKERPDFHLAQLDLASMVQ